jgi:hypothetical protein
MYIKYKISINELESEMIKKFNSFWYRLTQHNNKWLLFGGINGDFDIIKEYETKEEAENELDNIAKAIEEGNHIYTIK